MKKILSLIMAVLLCVSVLCSSTVFYGATTSLSEPYDPRADYIGTAIAGMSYKEYFSERRVFGDEYRYTLLDTINFGEPKRVSGEWGEFYENTWFFKEEQPNDKPNGYYTDFVNRYPEMKEVKIPAGSVFINRTNGGESYPVFFGSGYTDCHETVGHLYTIKGTEVRCWDLCTFESFLVYAGSVDEEISFSNLVMDELMFFSAGRNVYRYYRPSHTLELVFTLAEDVILYDLRASDIIRTVVHTPEYFEVLEKSGLAEDPYRLSSRPKDPIAFYTWVNQRFGVKCPVPTEKDIAEAPNGEWGVSVIYTFDMHFPEFQYSEETFTNFDTGEILSEGEYPALEDIPLRSCTRESYYPDIASPWLGNRVKVASESLKELLSTVPAGAFWGQDVTSDNVVYTSLGNNQDRVLITALMKSENITRPEKRESLTPEAQAGKTPIPAAKVKAMYESLYGPGTAETLLQREVIGDAIAGDFLLKTEGGDYVYAWAPYAGVTLNSDQVIRYLSHEEKGDTLEVYVSYGLYRYDDGRETYKLFGDARALRYLEFPLTAPLAVGKVGDGTLTDLRDGFLKDLATYKLTFKKDADGYYWAASSLLPANGEIPAPTVSEEPSFPWVPVALTAGLSVVVTGLVAVGIFVPILNRRKKKTTE